MLNLVLSIIDWFCVLLVETVSCSCIGHVMTRTILDHIYFIEVRFMDDDDL